MMRWDWYAATVPLRAQQFIPALARRADLVDVAPSRPMHGYTDGAELKRGSQVICRALWGGHNGNHVHAWSSGEHAEWFVANVRELAPRHRVTRADSAGDYSAPGMWDLLSEAALVIADEFGVCVQHVGDFHRGELGRTLYIGSRSSVAQLVVYEKGKQVGGDPNWVRIEARIRPKSDARETVAALSALEVWGCASWLRAFARRVQHDEVERHSIGTVYRATDEARAFAAVARQYGKLFARKAAELGGYAALGNFLGELINAPTSDRKH